MARKNRRLTKAKATWTYKLFAKRRFDYTDSPCDPKRNPGWNKRYKHNTLARRLTRMWSLK